MFFIHLCITVVGLAVAFFGVFIDKEFMPWITQAIKGALRGAVGALILLTLPRLLGLDIRNSALVWILFMGIGALMGYLQVKYEVAINKFRAFGVGLIPGVVAAALIMIIFDCDVFSVYAGDKSPVPLAIAFYAAIGVAMLVATKLSRYIKTVENVMLIVSLFGLIAVQYSVWAALSLLLIVGAVCFVFIDEVKKWIHKNRILMTIVRRYALPGSLIAINGLWGIFKGEIALLSIVESAANKAFYGYGHSGAQFFIFCLMTLVLTGISACFQWRLYQEVYEEV